MTGKRMTVVTGSFPPDVCGVGDYTRALVRQLEQRATEVYLFYRKNWSLSNWRKYRREILDTRPEILNVQYPTEGYGYSILPQLLCASIYGCRKIVTIHEFSSKSLKGKVAIWLFFIFADLLIFTSEIERRSASQFAPWITKRSCVIAIGANIPFHPQQEKNVDVVYFGLIRPIKGIESFLDTICRVKDTRGLKVRLIGQIVPGYEEYGARIIERARDLEIEIVLGQAEIEVAKLISECRVALLPFPDGISQRRGSALAAMANGALVISLPPSDASEREVFEEICLMSSSSELPETLLRVLRDYTSFETIRSKGQEFARRRSWQWVGESYFAQIHNLPKDASASHQP